MCNKNNIIVRRFTNPQGSNASSINIASCIYSLDSSLYVKKKNKQAQQLLQKAFSEWLHFSPEHQLKINKRPG